MPDPHPCYVNPFEGGLPSSEQVANGDLGGLINCCQLHVYHPESYCKKRSGRGHPEGEMFFKCRFGLLSSGAKLLGWISKSLKMTKSRPTLPRNATMAIEIATVSPHCRTGGPTYTFSSFLTGNRPCATSSSTPQRTGNTLPSYPASSGASLRGPTKKPMTGALYLGKSFLSLLAKKVSLP